jgi:hypothetical protein
MAIPYPVEVLPTADGSSVATMTRKYSMLNLQETEITHTELLLQCSHVTDVVLFFVCLLVQTTPQPSSKALSADMLKVL